MLKGKLMSGLPRLDSVVVKGAAHDVTVGLAAALRYRDGEVGPAEQVLKVLLDLARDGVCAQRLVPAAQARPNAEGKKEGKKGGEKKEEKKGRKKKKKKTQRRSNEYNSGSISVWVVRRSGLKSRRGRWRGLCVTASPWCGRWLDRMPRMQPRSHTILPRVNHRYIWL